MYYIEMEPQIALSQLAALIRGGTRHTVPKGQVVQVSSRNLLFYVRSGYIKRYLITDTGAESIQTINGPGEVFPLTPVFKILLQQEIYRGSEMYFYEAMSDARLYSIGEPELVAAVEADPTLYKELLSVAGSRLSSNIQRLENVSLVSARRRVAHHLAYLAQKFGNQDKGTILIQVPLTHQDIAAMLSLARETVSHVMGGLKNKKIIKTDAKAITILDMSMLWREAS